MEILDTGINKPKGFKTNAIYAGIKKRKRDLAIIYSEVPCICAGVFTENTIKAEPVLWDEKIIKSDKKAQAIVIVSGIANSCTGQQGVINNYKIVEEVSKSLHLDEESILICCTGDIGKQLPVATIQKGIKVLSTKLNKSRMAAINTAKAIMTTDTIEKEITVQIELKGKKVIIAGIAKGSTLVCPSMATTLGVLTTDANISKELFQKALKEACDVSFNLLCLDGEGSTNDTVLGLANGLALNEEIKENSKEYYTFKNALQTVCKSLAIKIAKDGQGSSKFVKVVLKGVKERNDVRKLIRSILGSIKFKTSIHGCQLNWGTIINAMSSTDILFSIDNLSIEFASPNGCVEVIKDGIEVEYDPKNMFKILNHHNITITINLNEGIEEGIGWGCDITCQYIKINSQCKV